jgi:regulator of RNase E activity RraA
MQSSPSIGFRIHLNTPRPPDNVLAGFQGVPSGLVCDAMDRYWAMDYRIKPLDPTSKLCGAALTVRTRPGDNLMVWKALEVARPGDVLVIATQFHTATSTFGELVALAAVQRGLAGIVCDGACRDASGIRATGLATFVMGFIPSSPGKDGPGEIGGLVNCGGIPVHAGDILVGDEDGVAVVPLADSANLLERLTILRTKEQALRDKILAGQVVPEWVDSVLNDKGCEVIS